VTPVPDGSYRIRSTTERILPDVQRAFSPPAGRCERRGHYDQSGNHLLSPPCGLLRFRCLRDGYTGQVRSGHVWPGAAADCVLLPPTANWYDLTVNHRADHDFSRSFFRGDMSKTAIRASRSENGPGPRGEFSASQRGILARAHYLARLDWSRHLLQLSPSIDRATVQHLERLANACHVKLWRTAESRDPTFGVDATGRAHVFPPGSRKASVRIARLEVTASASTMMKAPASTRWPNSPSTLGPTFHSTTAALSSLPELSFARRRSAT